MAYVFNKRKVSKTRKLFNYLKDYKISTSLYLTSAGLFLLSGIKFIEGDIDEATQCISAATGTGGFAFGYQKGIEEPRVQKRLFRNLDEYSEYAIYQSVYEMSSQIKSVTKSGKKTKALNFIKGLNDEKNGIKDEIDEKLLKRYGTKIKVAKSNPSDALETIINETDYLNHVNGELDRVEEKSKTLRAKYGSKIDSYIKKFLDRPLIKACYRKITGCCDAKDLDSCCYKDDLDLPDPLLKEKVALDSLSATSQEA